MKYFALSFIISSVPESDDAFEIWIGLQEDWAKEPVLAPTTISKRKSKRIPVIPFRSQLQYRKWFVIILVLSFISCRRIIKILVTWEIKWYGTSPWCRGDYLRWGIHVKDLWTMQCDVRGIFYYVILLLTSLFVCWSQRKSVCCRWNLQISTCRFGGLSYSTAKSRWCNKF